MMTQANWAARWLPLALFCLFMMPAAAVQAQQKIKLADADVQPEYPGGQQALFDFLIGNIQYPAAAKAAKLEQTIFVKFLVDTDGSIRNIEPAKQGFDADLWAESKRVVEKMPKWKPAEKAGKKVKVEYVLPIKYRLGA
jgi:periplasmic protein TonB